MAKNNLFDDEDEDWAQYLTPARRRHFERTGRYLVEQQVNDHRYSSVEKRKAAMHWLGEQRRRDRRQTITLHVSGLLVAAFAALLGAYLGAEFTHRNALELRDLEVADKRDTLVNTLVSDIESLMKLEADRFAALRPALGKMIAIDSLVKEGGRPWLMPPAPSQFPVFEQNASQLGALGAGLATQVAQFYGLSYELRSRINIAISPAILAANTQERELAVQDYEQSLRAWQTRGKELLSSLTSQIVR